MIVPSVYRLLNAVHLFSFASSRLSSTINYTISFGSRLENKTSDELTWLAARPASFQLKMTTIFGYVCFSSF